MPEYPESLELLRQLVAIDSVNPSLVPGGAGERKIANFVAQWLSDVGLEAELQEFAPGPFNAIGVLKGLGGGRSLMLNAHMDTVSLGQMSEPLSLRVEGWEPSSVFGGQDSKAFGRGAYDMKGSLAAIMLAAKRLASSEEKLGGDVVVAAVGDEEHASLGTQGLLETIRTDAAIVTEPTSLQICVAHKGFAWLRIETEGVAAHGSKPDLGVDAIGMMGHVLGRLNELETEIESRSPHPLLGTGSIHASLIEGGQELSSYPARCVLQVERRTLPADSKESVVGEFEGILRLIEKEVPDFRASAEMFFWRDAFEISANEAIVRLVQTMAAGVESEEPIAVVGETPWMDSALTQAAGIPTVVFGPVGSGAHGDHEWVHPKSIEDCAVVYERVARMYCSQRDAPH